MNDSNSTSITITKDGSTTLYSSRFNQHYHNPNGAVAESRHVFFETPRLPDAIKQKKALNIFETGFGTGLNLLLLSEYLKQSESQTVVNYYSVEGFPVDSQTAGKFDFGDNPELNKTKPLMTDIFDHLQPGLNKFKLSEYLTLHLFIGLFDEFFKTNQVNKKIDFVLHDPFSPEANPDLWTVPVFQSLASISCSDAVLTTYCAATSARAAMAVAGWNVARAKGALGKREMTVASLNPEKLDSFKRINEKRLIERFERGDFPEIK